MFEQFKGYNSPEITQVNKKCSMAIYTPNSKKLEVIVGINNTNTDSIIYLKSTTLINISNNMIIKLLNTLPKIKNKRVSKKKAKKFAK